MTEFAKWWKQDDIKNNLNKTFISTVTIKTNLLLNTKTSITSKTFTNDYENSYPKYLSLIGNESDIINILDNNQKLFYNINSNILLLLIVLYSCIIFLGILCNASLVLTITSSIRLRNPLLISLCIADLIVTGLSAPITLTLALMTQKTWQLQSIGCKILYYLQSLPVAASTFSFFMLSLDRYATVRHPSLAQLRQRRYVHSILAAASWIGASIICIPIILAYNIFTYKISNNKSTSFELNSIDKSYNNFKIQQNLNNIFNIHNNNDGANAGYYLNNNNSQNYTTCRPEFVTSFILIHTFLVFIVPGFGVVLNHYGVRRKLCALSLTARAQHGELPLPMPILRRPTHMIIVTGMANAARGVVSDNDSSDDQENVNARNFMKETIIKTNTNAKSPRVMREIRVQQQKQKQKQRKIVKCKNSPPTTAGIPLPQTSTLRSRRRLANILVFSAILFCGFWSPHVYCIVRSEFAGKKYCSNTTIYFSLLLGYIHSVISPIIYWILNHNSLRQSACAPFFIRFGTVQRFIRSHLRPTAPDPPSSTNEAALGAFNPRYIKTTHKQYRAQASSHYLY